MGRIDVHAHLLPGVDDGCQTLEDSLACARRLVERGYSHCFCTPHIWRNLPHNNSHAITQGTQNLQVHLDAAGIPLSLLPGGEINLHPEVAATPPDEIVSYGMLGRHVLIDLWAERLPAHFEPAVRWFQSQGLTVILAHPERMRAVQDEPLLADRLAELGVLLQGNLQCFADPPHMHTRRIADRFLAEGRYFMLGTDLHGIESLGPRLAGFERVQSLVDRQQFDRLTVENPQSLFSLPK